MIILSSHEYLDKNNIPYTRAEFPPNIEKGAASVARALGYRERQMIKTLIFELHTGERILVMVGGDQNIVSGLLKKAAGVAKYQDGQFRGCQRDSIPPFSWQPENFRSFLEVSLKKEPVLGVGTGVWGHEILITPVNLVKASRANLVNLVNRTNTG